MKETIPCWDHNSEQGCPRGWKKCPYLHIRDKKPQRNDETVAATMALRSAEITLESIMIILAPFEQPKQIRAQYYEVGQNAGRIIKKLHAMLATQQ